MTLKILFPIGFPGSESVKFTANLRPGESSLPPCRVINYLYACNGDLAIITHPNATGSVHHLFFSLSLADTDAAELS